MRGRVVALAFVALAASPLATGEPWVFHPGDAVGAGICLSLPGGCDFAACSLGFMFRDSGGGVYFGTAGHCFAVGATVGSPHGILGTVVFSRDDRDAFDFALIRVAEGVAVAPGVRDLGGPTGVASESATFIGDIVSFAGHPGGAEDGHVRDGVLRRYTDSLVSWSGLAAAGDSGGPVIHKPTGLALGVVSDFGPLKNEVATDVGPSMIAVLKETALAGYPVQLVTAPYTPRTL